MLAAKGDEPSVHSGPGESGLLYLQRNRVSTGNQRFLVNSREIERRAKKNGLEIVDPAAFDFLDQVRLFLRARLVVSPIGAAIMNTAFAPKGCRVLCLSPYYKGANYYYFSSLSRILEHDLAYVLGEQVMGDSRKISIIHRNYEIDPDIFEAALVEQLSLIRSTDSSAS
jgi:capsular polysaccharide biosynthesis protein